MLRFVLVLAFVSLFAAACGDDAVPPDGSAEVVDLGND
jgi:hypothetical protein